MWDEMSVLVACLFLNQLVACSLVEEYVVVLADVVLEMQFTLEAVVSNCRHFTESGRGQ